MFRLFHYLKRHWPYAIISPVFMLGEVMADLALPFLMSMIINYGIMGLNAGDPQHGSMIAEWLLQTLAVGSGERMDIIIVFGVLMLCISLVGGAAGVMAAYTSSRAAQGFGHDLRCDAYRKVMEFSIEQTDYFTTGSLITRLTSDITMVMSFMESLLRGFIRSPIFIIGGAVMLLMLHAAFGAVLLCIVPILAIIIWGVLRKAIPMFMKVQNHLDIVNSIVQENVTGARVIKAYVQEESACERFNKANTDLCTVNYRVEKMIAIISPMLTLMQNYAIIFIIFIGGSCIQQEYAGMTTGAIMAAITYITQAVGAVLMAANLFQLISRADASAERLCEVLDTEPVIKKRERKASDKNPEDSYNDKTILSFQNVGFSYPNTNSKKILQGINLNIKKNETLAVIGATGSGKTTLVSLILRFYDVTEGAVLLYGRDIKTYDVLELRKKIGYVMQKTELFTETIEENIRWGNSKASAMEIRDAAAMAQAAEFIEKTPDQYQTYIAEKGAS